MSGSLQSHHSVLLFLLQIQVECAKQVGKAEGDHKAGEVRPRS